MSDLNQYAHRFAKLRRDRVKGWPASARGKSPYKPLLLLAVLDQFDQGQITHNLIELTPDLGNLFDLYCATVLPPSMVCNIACLSSTCRASTSGISFPCPAKRPSSLRVGD